MSTVCKSLDARIEKATASEFDARFVLSAGSPDRVKDTIDPAAYDAVASRTTSLIALFNHDPDQIAGYWKNLKRVADTLIGDIKFASTPLGQMLKTLVDDGVPLGSSIGFRGRGEQNKSGGFHFKEIDLLETSIVSIPAHPRAMQIAKSFGIELPSSQALDSRAASGPHPAVISAKAAILRANRSLRSQK